MYLLALCEISQRFAFWGIANTLVLYLVQALQWEEARATHLFGIFTGLAFLLPAAGGYLGDRFSHKMTLAVGGIATAVGCFLLATGTLSLLYVALLLAALGASLFTPSVYALLGQVYHNYPSLRESGFTIYYAAVNLGVFIATLLLGALGQWGWWKGAFLVAGLVQTSGLLLYRSMKTMLPASQHLASSEGEHPTSLPLTPHELSRLAVIGILSLFSILFWIAYNQGGSSMTLFALYYTDRSVGSFTLPPSWLLSSESLYIVLLALPLAHLYHRLKQRRRDPSPPAKGALCLIAVSLCFFVMTLGSLQIPGGAQSASVSPGYLILAYLLMALGEMLIAPIGLSLITHIAPRRMTALLVGVWYFCIGVAFYLGGYLASWMGNVSSLFRFFGIFAILPILAALLLYWLTPRLNSMRHLDSL